MNKRSTCRKHNVSDLSGRVVIADEDHSLPHDDAVQQPHYRRPQHPHQAGSVHSSHFVERAVVRDPNRNLCF